MTDFTKPTFTVPTGSRKPEECGTHWWSANKKCVFCGLALRDVYLDAHVEEFGPPTPEEQEPE